MVKSMSEYCKNDGALPSSDSVRNPTLSLACIAYSSVEMLHVICSYSVKLSQLHVLRAERLTCLI